MFGAGSYVRTVKVGDRVLFARDDPYEVDVHGVTYLVLRERELHAVATERTEHGTGLRRYDQPDRSGRPSLRGTGT